MFSYFSFIYFLKGLNDQENAYQQTHSKARSEILSLTKTINLFPKQFSFILLTSNKYK